MYDPEDNREIPTTWREYLAQSKEMVGAIQWAWREFKTSQALHWYRRLILAAICMTVFSAAWPKSLAVVQNGISKRDLNLVIIGLVTFSFCLIVQRLIDNRHGTAREWLFGLNNGELDNCVSERFFEKSMGQHVEENFRLNPESIMTGRERLLAVQSLLFFEGIPTVIALSFSYVLVWTFGLIVGSTSTLTLALYSLYMLYLNQEIIEHGTPIEIEWKRLKRYRFERMKNVERVKTSAKEIAELQTMRARFLAVLTKDRSLWLWYIKHVLVRGMILIIGLLIIVGYGVNRIWTGHWPIGTLIPLIMWNMVIVENAWRVGHIERELNWFMPSIRHMIEALSIPPAIVSKPNAVIIRKDELVEVTFDHVTHTYPLGSDDEAGEIESLSEPVIKDVSFTVKPGEKVALIGDSGAGKTTLMKLLLRFMDPDSGSIRINGHDLRDVDLSSWMQSTAYIPQREQILDGTIAYNLKYALSPQEYDQWDDERLWELVRKLRIDFGKRLNKGLQTVVGEHGVKLSGGQAQRVMIGAAAIQHPPFMIIDEAYSSLDSSTERAVNKGLTEILSDRVGALIIAHRLSTIRSLCDRFIVLRNAEEVTNGGSQVEAIANSFEELYPVSPTFRRLADDQCIVI